MRFTDAVRDAGITYRQGDYWRLKYYVRATAEGTGYESEISRREALVMARMGVLVRAGMLAGSAAVIARNSVERDVSDVDLPGGLRVTFGVRP